MNSQVDASTEAAGRFFAKNRFLVPDYQRKYSWDKDTQVVDFWRDLSGGITQKEYFLGLVILSDGPDRLEVVDGQQRLVTLTILANVLRLSAQQLGRRLVAESVRSDFLFSMDFQTEEQVGRIELTDPSDRDDLAMLLNAKSVDELILRPDSVIHEAHRVMYLWLREDLERHENPALRVGQWTEFITKGVTFAVFMHPNREAAFKVYEVVNTRGRNLTPAELIKSFLIGSSAAGDQRRTHERWNAIEDLLDGLDALDQLTTFVRHVVTLDHGYVIPRELYHVVSTNYRDERGVERLFERLESRLPVYAQMLDPSADVESSETRTRAFALADTLSMSRFRPILLAASLTADPDPLLEDLLDILVPGVLANEFGTGSIEAQFARAARRVHNGAEWASELRKLRELRPGRDIFTIRLSRNLSKAQAHVVRAAYLQEVRTPTLLGFPHQVRPRNGVEWPGFDANQYRELGGFVGNWVLTQQERRPQNSHTPATVRERILPNLIGTESVDRFELDLWTAEMVRERTEAILNRVGELWYGDL
ncbi:hypothetical protein L1277_001240 [Okibacterium sp. HSC-33S16]|uniref:DUF262 domain-containing protein n=1 Tax=Okibacterium sp. HSC-33S16 TaxID=2910965 RepID=UPI0020A0CEEC|nr:DUF262 domain-containing protein [Okibacterium sp. HSC-33S16]MCP2031149.1 hypothetical protein [Okibacterium sp. HSC-33S16]